MAQFRAKAAPVDAFQLPTSPNPGLPPPWLMDAAEVGLIGMSADHIAVREPEGDARADLGDWIVRLPGGTLRAVKASVFAATYEAA